MSDDDGDDQFDSAHDDSMKKVFSLTTILR